MTQADGSQRSAAQEIAAGYAVDGAALQLGGVSVDGVVDAGAQVRIPLAMMNRHGLVAGATGTGKTKTLQVIAEQLSTAGVPVVMADIKGDLSGLSRPGEPSDRISKRVAEIGDDWAPAGHPCEFVSLGTGGVGVPIRATVTSFGPILLSKVLGLNDTQESTLRLIFHWADTRGLALLDLKDLRAVIAHLTGDEGKADLAELGGVSKATAGVILRALTTLEADGGDTFFGETEIDPADLFRSTARARGSSRCSNSVTSRTPGAVLDLPHVDPRRPLPVPPRGRRHRQAEARVHLRRGAPAVQRLVEGVRRAGRADREAHPLQGRRGVLLLPVAHRHPESGALAARCAHPARPAGVHPGRPKALSKTVKTYPTSTAYDLEKALTSLGIGEAIVTVLSERGAPTRSRGPVVRPPRSLMAGIGGRRDEAAATASPLHAKYAETIDRESAYEKLNAKVLAPADAPAAPETRRRRLRHLRPRNRDRPASPNPVWCRRSWAIRR